jgi:hypothetical protein
MSSSCVGEGVVQQHGGGVQRGLELRDSGRLRIEQVGVSRELFAQLPIQLALAVGKFARHGL